MPFEACLRLVEQAHVLDRDRGLVREGPDELDLPRRECADCLARDDKRAERSAFAHHRDSKNGPRTGESGHPRLSGDGRFHLEIVHLEWRAARQREADDRTFGQLEAVRDLALSLQEGRCVLGRASDGDRPEAAAFDEVHPSDLRLRKPHRIPRRGVEDRAQIERGAADDLQDIADRGLLPERLLRLVVEANVFDRDRGLIGERLEQLDFARIERATRAPARAERARHLAVAYERDNESRRRTVLGKLRMLRHVFDVLTAALSGRPAHDGIAVDRYAGPGHGIAGGPGRREHEQRVAVSSCDDTALAVDELYGALDDRRHHRLEVECAPADRAQDVADRGLLREGLGALF